MQDSLSPIPDAVEIRESLPRPQWDYPKSVKDILNNANFIDAGDAAFINSYASLAERVSQFLGGGRPTSILQKDLRHKAMTESALWHLSDS